MTDQDPPIEPLRRLDPSEPDDQDLGRLERLDPDADDAPAVAPADPGSRPPSGAGARLRDGLSAAITLAVLLSLSSIAAIGGLVAVSMRTVAPSDLDAVVPVDAGTPVTIIRVGESAQGAEEPDRDRREPQRQADDAVVDFTPVAPPPVNDGGGSSGGGDGGGGKGSGGGKSGVGGAWCDARQGSSCDAVVGGAVLQPASEPEGYLGTEEDQDDDAADDDEDSSGPSHHPGKGH